MPQGTTSFVMPSNNNHRHHQRQSGITEMGMSVSTKKMPGTAELDTPWEELGFEFRPTNSHVQITFKDGEWGAPELKKVS